MIDEGLKEQAESQSNIDAMMQQAQAEQQQAAQAQSPQMQQGVPAQNGASVPMPSNLGANAKVLKLATLAMLFQKIHHHIKPDRQQSQNLTMY